ncbi:OmpA family protein [Carboxylicivirga sp. N1Y90]|uniref:OmpA family protein n=1 Tax=Carboxylicivirga fragile TaxID=3417571 RepID=UPI003D34B5C1|nr:OmpA family protein [Marinilabiliaceae bacterium N1Y90]
MKTIIIIGFLLLTWHMQAQVQVDVGNKVEKKTNQKANQKTDEAIDKTFDKLEEGIGSLFGKKKKKNNKVLEEESTSVNNSSSDVSPDVTDDNNSPLIEHNVKWSKFDFVPGDEVIFEDAPNLMEENGEFPSRWDLSQGQVEIMMVNEENVIGFVDGSPEIIPYLKNSKEDYLPEVFTVEFDIYRPAYGNRFSLYLYDRKNQIPLDKGELEINLNRADIADITSEYDSGKSNEQGNWIHVSVAYTKGKLKVYLDENRLINIPRYEPNPSGLSFQAYWAEAEGDKLWYMKNVRIAKGGVKYYDRILSDGKIICNGIRFDVNKATLKRESMGPINKIYELMHKQPDLNFSVEGHTDADGDDAKNQTLSEQRAKKVMNQLCSMGISADRLSYKGFGESMPLDNNTTPEGKANNRRVEFVKK